MKRCMVALDVQNHFKPSQGMLHHINQMVEQMPTVATVFTHDDTQVPLTKLGKTGPRGDTCLVNTSNVFNKYGYGVPQEVINWLKEENPDEVLLTGGHTDANVLAAGFSLFDAGFMPVKIPLLCYGNEWYMHTVTTGIWAESIGKVYESVAELQFGGM